MNLLTYKHGSEIPGDYLYINSLIPFVECNKTTIWSRDTILHSIYRITSEQLGIPIDKINVDSHFVTDLGAD